MLWVAKPSELLLKSRIFEPPVLSIYYVIKAGGRGGKPNAYSVLQKGGSERPQIVLHNKLTAPYMVKTLLLKKPAKTLTLENF